MSKYYSLKTYIKHKNVLLEHYLFLIKQYYKNCAKITVYIYYIYI